MTFSFDDVQTKPVDIAPFVILFAPNGHGKTSFILSINDPFVIDTENKYQKTTVQRYVPNTFQDVTECLMALYNLEKFPGNALAIDTVDWLEMRIHDDICKSHRRKDGTPAKHINDSSVEELKMFRGGVIASNMFNSYILSGLMAIRERHNIPIILCCQTIPVDPRLPIDDLGNAMDLRLDKNLRGYLADRVEAKMYLQIRHNKDFKGKIIPTKERYHITEPQKGIAAKNSLHLPDEIPVGEYTGWNDFVSAINTNKTPRE